MFKARRLCASCLRLIDCVHHSALGLRVIKKKKKKTCTAIGCRSGDVCPGLRVPGQTDPLPPWRQPRGKTIVSLVHSHTNATRIGWHLWEIYLRFAPELPSGWRRRPARRWGVPRGRSGGVCPGRQNRHLRKSMESMSLRHRRV